MCCESAAITNLLILLAKVILALFCYLSSPSTCNEDSGFDDIGNWTVLPNELPGEVGFLRQIPLQKDPQREKSFTYEQIDKLRGKYKLEDFLWTGSGDGPSPSEPQDGGLAWEENGAYGSGVVLVTKTMVLFKTVITTVFPEEKTPVPVTPTLTVTPTPTDSFSVQPTESPGSSIVSSTQDIFIEPTPTIEVSPTSTLTIVEIFSSTTPTTPKDDPDTITSSTPEPMPTPAPGLQTDETTYSNPVYWVNTIIKANGSQVQGEFQNEMQKNLAQVYASAFKRHLLSSLGVLKVNSSTAVHETNAFHRRRKRSPRPRWKDSSREELDFQWLLLRDTGMTISQIKSLAATVMNVSVSIVNITSDDAKPHVSMDYVVTAEGNPVAASAAVQDLHLITKREMEKQIGYEIIKKAEPLISLPSPTEPSNEGVSASSPWLIVAITTICLLVVLIFVLIFMVWKWKHNRLGDTTIRARPQSGIEGGVTNPAFLGPPSPIERSEMSERRHRERPSSSIIIKTEKDADWIRKEHDRRVTRATTKRAAEERQTALASELNKQLDKDKSSSPSSTEGGIVKTSRRRSGTDDNESVTATRRSPPSKSSEEESERKHRRRKEVVKVTGSSVQSPEVAGTSKARKTEMAEKRARRKTQVIGAIDKGQKGDEEQHLRPSSASRGKIRYDHLDLSQDPVAKAMSDEARRLLQQSKARTHEGTFSPTETGSGELTSIRRRGIDERRRAPDEEPSSVNNEGTVRERIEQFTEEKSKPSTKDAQVQTPTRVKGLKTKSKPVPKARPSHSSGKLSTESLLSTESEEILEIRETESSSEVNPLGKMRKRFHQFLDDAFNVMGKREGEVDEGNRAKSAKVTMTHEIERREGPSRPWSQLIREESLEQIRPQSATPSNVVPPKRAWTAGTQQRRCQSAASGQIPTETKEEEQEVQETDVCDLTSTTVEPSSAGHQSLLTFSGPVFPGYPIYPDLPLPNTQLGASQRESRGDSAVPLIEAIKMEIKRFDKEKEQQSSSSK